MSDFQQYIWPCTYLIMCIFLPQTKLDMLLRKVSCISVRTLWFSYYIIYSSPGEVVFAHPQVHLEANVQLLLIQRLKSWIMLELEYEGLSIKSEIEQKLVCHTSSSITCRFKIWLLDSFATYPIKILLSAHTKRLMNFLNKLYVVGSLGRHPSQHWTAMHARLRRWQTWSSCR
jgi:hypothetical protein